MLSEAVLWRRFPGGNRIDARSGRRSPGDERVPGGDAVLALDPPTEPARACGAGGYDAAARELHRTRSLPAGARHGGAVGGVDGAHAARAQRAPSRRGLRPRLPGVVVRRRGATAGAPGARHDPRRPPPLPGDGRAAPWHPRRGEPGVRRVPPGRRSGAAGAAGERLPPGPPPRRPGPPGHQPARVGPAHHREPAGTARCAAPTRPWRRCSPSSRATCPRWRRRPTRSASPFRCNWHRTRATCGSSRPSPRSPPQPTSPSPNYTSRRSSPPTSPPLRCCADGQNTRHPAPLFLDRWSGSDFYVP